MTTYTIASANTWEQKAVSIDGDTSGTWETDSDSGMYLIFSLGAGTNKLGVLNAWTTTAGAIYGATGQTNVVATNGATWYVTGVQLEKGDSATPFEFRHHSTELALCQRYYRKTFPPGTAPAQLISVTGSIATTASNNSRLAADVRFDPPMRGLPSVALYSIAGSGAASGQWFNIDSGGASSSATHSVGPTGGAIFGVANTGNVACYIQATFDADYA